MQIKIRAWDKDSETMIYGVGITPESDGGIPYQIPVNAHDFDQLDYYPNSIIMLYTGLKDKNGTEIYEGDIVKFHFPNPYNTVVKFKNGHFAFYKGKRMMVDPYYYTNHVWSYAKVIGNIYEHHHLLGGEEE